MSLPISIDNIPYYKVAGQYCFKGDLILTTGNIFFFPHTDLEQRRTELREVLFHMHLYGVGILFDSVIRPILVPLLLPLVFRTSNDSDLRTDGLWRDGESSEALKSKLDERIAELKRTFTPSVSLPIPPRFNRDEVSNLKLSAAGTLSFDAQSDNHSFAVGIIKKRLLRDALWESGFTSGLQNT